MERAAAGDLHILGERARLTHCIWSAASVTVGSPACAWLPDACVRQCAQGCCPAPGRLLTLVCIAGCVHVHLHVHVHVCACRAIATSHNGPAPMTFLPARCCGWTSRTSPLCARGMPTVSNLTATWSPAQSDTAALLPAGVRPAVQHLLLKRMKPFLS